jgi:hypothetical protein
MGAVRGGGFVLGSRVGRWIVGVDWAANVTNTIGAIGECIWVWSNERFFSSAFLLTNVSSLIVPIECRPPVPSRIRFLVGFIV